MDVPIVFEDDSFLVIDKPFGVVVNRAETTKTETIQDWAENYLSLPKHTGHPGVTRSATMSNLDASQLGSSQEDAIAPLQHDEIRTAMTIEEEFASRGGVVHRLDKDTSGLLVIAKNPQAFENLKNQFKERSTVKKYIALVHGKVEPPVGKINAPIERSPFNRMHFGVFPGGREALTDYKVLKNLKLLTEFFSLLEVTPHTGRTHQIRVHMKYINHPIVSDPIYGGRKNFQNDLSFCPRLFLHAKHLEISHPVTGVKMGFDSDLPPDLQTVLDSLH